MSKIFEIKTEHVIPFKTLFEVLKEVLNDVVIEVNKSDSSNHKKELNQSEETLISRHTKNSNSDNEEQPVSMKSKRAEISKKKVKDDGKESNTNNNNSRKSEDGGNIRIITVDHTKTLLIHVKLLGDKFSVFDTKYSKYDVGINLTQFHKIIKSLDKDDTLTMYIEEEDKQKITFLVDNDEKKSRSTFYLKLMDIDKTEYNLPPIKRDVAVIMDSSEFHRVCREMAQLSDYVDITCTNNNITFMCKGDSITRSTKYTANENGVKIIVEGNKNIIVQGIFDLKYLTMFTKCANICGDIQIYMKNAWPLFIKYSVATLGSIELGIVPVDEKNISNNFDDDEFSDDDIEIKFN